MANATLQPDVITKESLILFHNNLTFTRQANRQYDNSNSMGGQKNGGAIRLRLPNKYSTQTGAALATGTDLDTTEQAVTLPAGTQRHVDSNFTTNELTNDIDTFSERILAPKMSVLAAMTDYSVLSNVTKQMHNSVGTAGTTPATAAVLLNAHKYLNYFAVPQGSRYACVDPDANAALVDGLKGLFNPSTTVADQFKTGMMGKNVLGFRDMSMSQSVYVHTCGTRSLTDTILVNGTLSVEGDTTISIDGGTGSATVTAGDVFTVADCYSVNPETKQSTGKLQQFVVTTANTASGGAWTDIAFSPAVYTTGPLQNVNSFPTDGKAVTFIGTASTQYAQNVAFDSQSVIVATTDLELPEGVHFKSRQVLDGISMRLVRQYRIATDDIPCRIDVLYASVLARKEGMVRIWG
jgi:hypothetical protein